MNCRSRIILLTNNPEFGSIVKNMDYIQGSSWDILVRARDQIHLGSELLNHPLYGNFRPYQQPFRSLILKQNVTPDLSNDSQLDFYSLELIENALSVYRSCKDRILLPGQLSQEAELDCSYLDYQLIWQTLVSYDLV